MARTRQRQRQKRISYFTSKNHFNPYNEKETNVTTKCYRPQNIRGGRERGEGKEIITHLLKITSKIADMITAEHEDVSI